MLLDIVPNHTSDQHAWFPAALAPGRARRRGSATCSGRAAAPTARSRPTTGRASSAARPGRGSPSPTARRASGTCTCSPPSSRTSTGSTPRSAPSSRTIAALLVRPRRRRLPDRRRARAGQAGRPARRRDLEWPRQPVEVDGELRRPPGSRTRSGTATRCTRSTAAGARSPTPTTRRGCSSPRRGSTSPSGWPATCAPTSCTPPSTSTTCRRPWDAGYLRHVIDETLDEHGAVGAPATWVLSNHDVARHVTRYAREQDRPGQQRDAAARPAAPTSSWAAGGPARRLLLMLGAARQRLRLPGRGARPARRSRTCPRTCSQDPTWERSGHTDRGRDGCRVPLPWSGTRPPYGFSPEGARPAAVAAAARRLGRAHRRGARPATPARCSSSTARRCGCAARPPGSATAR